MINIPNCSLVLIDTRSHDLALKTLLYQMEQCEFDEVLLLTDKDIKHERVSTHRVPTVNHISDYETIIYYNLPELVTTDHIILSQCDGYIINPSSWDASWLQYDYIGAPWWYFPYNHIPPHPPSTPNTCIGNGGFSLRSTKLLKETKRALISGRYKSTSPEDIFICRTLRPILEQRGCIWAPESVAWKFSCEDTTYRNQFGFHGHNTFRINPGIPRIILHCPKCENRPTDYCISCGRKQ